MTKTHIKPKLDISTNVLGLSTSIVDSISYSILEFVNSNKGKKYVVERHQLFNF